MPYNHLLPGGTLVRIHLEQVYPVNQVGNIQLEFMGLGKCLLPHDQPAHAIE